MSLLLLPSLSITFLFADGASSQMLVDDATYHVVVADVPVVVADPAVELVDDVAPVRTEAGVMDAAAFCVEDAEFPVDAPVRNPVTRRYKSCACSKPC